MKVGKRGLLGLTAFIVASGLFLSATGGSVVLAGGGRGHGGYGYRGGYGTAADTGTVAATTARGTPVMDTGVMDTGRGTETTITMLASRMAWLAIRITDIRATVTRTGIPPMDTVMPRPITAPITVQATAAILRRRPTWAPIPTQVPVRTRDITQPVRVAIRAAVTALGRRTARPATTRRPLRIIPAQAPTGAPPRHRFPCPRKPEGGLAISAM